jgi:hypothetical protein
VCRRAGIFGHASADLVRTVEAMVASIRYRGPEGIQNEERNRIEQEERLFKAWKSRPVSVRQSGHLPATYQAFIRSDKGEIIDHGCRCEKAINRILGGGGSRNGFGRKLHGSSALL